METCIFMFCLQTSGRDNKGYTRGKNNSQKKLLYENNHTTSVVRPSCGGWGSQLQNGSQARFSATASSRTTFLNRGLYISLCLLPARQWSFMVYTGLLHLAQMLGNASGEGTGTPQPGRARGKGSGLGQMGVSSCC